MNDYEKQATEFLEKTGSELKITYSHNGKYFEGDDNARDVYDCVLKRGSREYKFKFGQSVANSAKIVDKVTGNEFTLDGGCLKGKLKITDMDKYKSGRMPKELKEVKGTAPTSYDILACLEKYEVGTFEDFCSNCGYDSDSRTAEKVYKSVLHEYTSLCTLYSDVELETLQEIQ